MVPIPSHLGPPRVAVRSPFAAAAPPPLSAAAETPPLVPVDLAQVTAAPPPPMALKLASLAMLGLSAVAGIGGLAAQHAVRADVTTHAQPLHPLAGEAPNPAPQAAEKDWTILFYASGDGGLEPDIQRNIIDLEKVGSSDRLNIVVQTDTRDFAVTRFLVGRHEAQRADARDLDPRSPVLESTDDEQATPESLRDFVAWGMRAYPARHTMLIISSHGSGWQGALGGEGGSMSLREIHQGLAAAREATGKKLDVIGFDACLMASTEAAHSLRGDARVLLASEETIDGRGLPYSHILGDAPTGAGAIGMARHFVAATKGDEAVDTMSAVDLERMPAVDASMRGLAEAIKATPTEPSVLRGLARSTQAFTDYRDLYDFAKRIADSDRVQDKALKEAARSVVGAVDEAVVAEQHASSYPNARGLNIRLPGWFPAAPKDYRETEFDQETKWSDAQDRMGDYWFWPTPVGERTGEALTLGAVGGAALLAAAIASKLREKDETP